MKSAIFTDGTKARAPLMLDPSAIGVSYTEKSTEDGPAVTDDVAVICIEGPLSHKGGWWFFDSYESIASRFKAAIDDDAVKSIILKIDSPGGEVAGCFETVRLMQEMKKASGKFVAAYVDESCYSAAYALAMVADEIYLPPSAGVGSIGVITCLADVTKADEKQGVRYEVITSGAQKADGHPHVPMSEGAIARTQKRVNELAAQFFDLVAEARNLSPKKIAAMQAGIFMGDDAVAAGLADGILSLEDTLTNARNLFGSPTDDGTTPKGRKPIGDQAMTILMAAKALNEANEALAGAKGAAAKKAAAKAVAQAEKDLAKAKKMAEDAEEEEAEEEGAEEGEDSEAAEDDAEEEDAEEGDDDSEESEEDEDEEDEEEDAKGKKAAASHSPRALVALVRKITGKASIEEAMGALQAFADARTKTERLAAKVAKLEGNDRKSRLNALIAEGTKSGKLAPAQIKWARTQTPKALRAYLDATPKMVRALDEGGSTEAGVVGAKQVLTEATAEMVKIWSKQGFGPESFPALLEAHNKAAKAAQGVQK